MQPKLGTRKIAQGKRRWPAWYWHHPGSANWCIKLEMMAHTPNTSKAQERCPWLYFYIQHDIFNCPTCVHDIFNCTTCVHGMLNHPTCVHDNHPTDLHDVHSPYTDVHDAQSPHICTWYVTSPPHVQDIFNHPHAYITYIEELIYLWRNKMLSINTLIQSLT